MNAQNQKLLDLLEVHGAVPGFELTAEGLDIQKLLADGLIIKGVGRYQAGLYVAGPALTSSLQHQN